MEAKNKPTPVSLDESDLKKAIEDFYLPKHLVRAIYDIGHIPPHSQESQVGVGFIDIADYTYISKFLSPKENQILLNGLYTAFLIVLERHGGYLNKVEGDSMMFHFDCIIDKKLWPMKPEEATSHIARELFYTCVEMQRVCVLFNQANDKFVDETASETARAALLHAFDIIRNLRNKNELSSALEAFFQIRIRIGANIGEVTIGNFGPDGAKHWDVIGMPVINAKRMESTAPVGGLRISDEFYQILDKANVINDYYDRFKREAYVMGSVYKNIRKEELFAFREVVLREKKGASYKTYSVQVNPALPEALTRQVDSLLEHGQIGANRILEFIQYYRGNQYVMDSIEGLFLRKGIHLRKSEMLELIHPRRFKELLGKAVKDHQDPERLVGGNYTLFQLFQFMDKYQDIVQTNHISQGHENFVSFDESMSTHKSRILKDYEEQKFIIVQRTYFFDVVTPLVYLSIKNSVLEYQLHEHEALDVEDLEAV